MTFTTDVVMGEKYRDPKTGIEGHVTGVHFYEFGCERVTLQVLTNQGSLEEYGFDAPRLERVATGKAPRVERTGGPARGIESRGGMGMARGDEGAAPGQLRR